MSDMTKRLDEIAARAEAADLFEAPSTCETTLYDDVPALVAFAREVLALAEESGVGWFEWIAHPSATTHSAYVHEGGSAYLPDGEFTSEDFAGAAATGNAHRLVRADEIHAIAARTLDGPQ